MGTANEPRGSVGPQSGWEQALLEAAWQEHHLPGREGCWLGGTEGSVILSGEKVGPSVLLASFCLGLHPEILRTYS